MFCMAYLYWYIMKHGYSFSYVACFPGRVMPCISSFRPIWVRSIDPFFTWLGGHFAGRPADFYMLISGVSRAFETLYYISFFIVLYALSVYHIFIS